jgi:poly-gamma-glutamate capsule biosynthesis protein CapA/YwtB (metallophosphatase superfamily)
LTEIPKWKKVRPQAFQSEWSQWEDNLASNPENRNDFVELAAVGDIATPPDPPARNFELTLNELRSADLRFGQLERIYSERGSFQGQGLAPHVRQHPKIAEIFKEVPFDVMSVGSNHTGDWGPDAVEDTLRTFEALNIATVGAGRTITEARAERILEVKGLKIAFLGYVSVLLPQYWATENRAGATPMRANTYYEPYEYQPGSPPRIVTVPNAQDLAALQEDIRRAKGKADLVVVSMHWGVHWMPKPLPDYQSIVAHAAVDAGASLILGTHPHVIQGIERYKTAIIFYSLGNFSFFRREGSPNYCCPGGYYQFKDVYDFDFEPDHKVLHDRYRQQGCIAYIRFDKAGIRSVSALPTGTNDLRQAIIVDPTSAEFEKRRRYFDWVSNGLDGGLSVIRVDNGRFVLYDRGAA